MKFFAIAAGFAALASAVPEHRFRRQASSLDQASVIAVLETALPASLLQLAITNAPEATAVIASEFAAGQTPSWFTGLPADVQTYLVPVPAATAVVSASSTSTAITPPYAANATSSFASLIGANITAAAGNATAYGTGTAVAPYATNNATAIARNGTAVVAATNSASGSATSSLRSSSASASAAASSTHTGAASVPTAVFGAGIAGAVGLVAMLAL